MVKRNLDRIKFRRLFRTDSSEIYLCWIGKIRIGYIHLHYNRVIMASIILEKPLNADQFEKFVDIVCDEFEDVGYEDFIFTVFDGKVIGDYSNIVDHNENPSSRKDIARIEQQLKSVIGRHNRIKGHLSENMAREYFEHFGYTVRKATPSEDHAKIDLIANRESDTVYIQVKSGTISHQNIQKSIKYIKQHLSTTLRNYSIAFVASDFPVGIEFERVRIEDQSQCRIFFVSARAIVQALPAYRQASS